MSALSKDPINLKPSQERPLSPQRSVDKIYKDKAYRWNRENYSRNRRFVDIWAFFLTQMAPCPAAYRYIDHHLWQDRIWIWQIRYQQAADEKQHIQAAEQIDSRQ